MDYRAKRLEETNSKRLPKFPEGAALRELSRSNGTTTYNYVYNGGQLTQMTVGNDTLYFIYDATGAPVIVLWNNSVYYYITSLQGDVLQIMNEDIEIVVTYDYDAWGNVVSVGGTMANTLGTLNPLRYRGYVYDQETQLYYLQSRYYNPEIGRFINADGYTSNGGLLGCNMFAYCVNCPTNLVDPNGQSPISQSNDGRQLVLAMALGAAAISMAAPISQLNNFKLTKTAARTSSSKKVEDVYSVYFLCAEGDPDQTIVYVGRVKSKNFEARMNYHKLVGRQLVASIDGLSYASCRAVEQGGMMYYHTINRGNSLNNQIRGISPTNKNYPDYLTAIMDYIASGLYPDDAFLPITYWENLVEEEFLNLGG